MTIKIFSREMQGGHQLFVKQFGIYDGVFGFETQEARKPTSSGDKVLADEHEECDFNRREGRSPTPEAFCLSQKEAPSATNPKLQFHWCDRGANKGVIELESEKEKYEVTFLKPNGTKLKGTFGCKLFSSNIE